ncbi:MAG: hypothetical protein Q8K12_02420 [Thiobacillus sp.]|nr:hypothetical protein [Thiobacillus sp.]
MITLNSEQGLITVESWDDIQSRPGFVTDLNPSNHILDSIIGRYMFRDKIRCGLSNCHTPHAKGYIATTKEGLSTNIGKDCGKRYFGVDFETMSKKFDRDVTEAENRSRLCGFSLQIEEVERTISELRQKPQGADWVYKKTRALVSVGNGCPEEVVRRISTMLKNGTNTLTTEREATSSEVDALEAMQGRKLQRPHVISEPVADIAGLQALYPENNVKDLLVLDLEANLRELKDKDIDSLAYDELRRWAKWADSVENTMERVANAVAHGGVLLAQSNLEPFSRVLVKREDNSLFRAYLRGLHE